MALQIGTDWITSDITNHRATRTEDGWTVTWLGRRIVSRNQAITAMTVAEYTPRGSSEPGWNESVEGRNWWGHLAGWCKELNVKPAFAIAQTWVDPSEDPAIQRRYVGPGQCPSWCIVNHLALAVIDQPQHGYQTTHRSAPIRRQLPLFGSSSIVVMQSPGRPPVVALVTGERIPHVELTAAEANTLVKFLTDRNGGTVPPIGEELLLAVKMFREIIEQATL